MCCPLPSPPLPFNSLKLASSSHLEVSCGADIILPQEDHKHVSTLAQRDRMVRAGGH